MRYSRFRSALLGLEPMRRNRTTTPKSRVTKSKKDPKPKKNDKAKAEPSASPAPPPSKSRETAPSPTPSPPVPVSKVKQEVSHHGLEDYWDSRLTPRLTPGPVPPPMSAPAPTPSMSTTPLTIQPRLLTPCSEADVFSPLSASPASDMINMPYDYSPLPAHGQAWHQPLSYSSPANSYTFNDFTMSCDHQHHPDNFALLNKSIEDDGEHCAGVKQERWDDCLDVKQEWDYYP